MFLLVGKGAEEVGRGEGKEEFFMWPRVSLCVAVKIHLDTNCFY